MAIESIHPLQSVLVILLPWSACITFDKELDIYAIHLDLLYMNKRLNLDHNNAVNSFLFEILQIN